jgi:hypothetical protein
MPPTAAREPDVPDLTSPEDRKAKLAEADAHAKAAGRAVMAFAREALAQLRGNEALPEPFTHWTYASVQRVPPGGTAEGLLSQISAEETEPRNKIAEAQRLIDEAGLRLREFMPLKMWLARNGQGGYGLVEPGANLQVPPSHTPGSKPRDLHVPGWYPPDPEGSEAQLPIADTVAEGQEHLIPDDAESGVVEMSDRWHLEQERKTRQEA